jgi:hypothetical protein
MPLVRLGGKGWWTGEKAPSEGAACARRASSHSLSRFVSQVSRGVLLQQIESHAPAKCLSSCPRAWRLVRVVVAAVRRCARVWEVCRRPPSSPPHTASTGHASPQERAACLSQSMYRKRRPTAGVVRAEPRLALEHTVRATTTIDPRPRCSSLLSALPVTNSAEAAALPRLHRLLIIIVLVQVGTCTSLQSATTVRVTGGPGHAGLVGKSSRGRRATSPSSGRTEGGHYLRVQRRAAPALRTQGTRRVCGKWSPESTMQKNTDRVGGKGRGAST